MNCAISDKKGELIFFIRDAFRSGVFIEGSNMKVQIKEDVFDILWTLDDLDIISEEVDGVIRNVYSKCQKDISPAPEFRNVPVGSKKEVNDVVSSEIRKVYSMDDEFRIGRLKAGGKSEEWEAYNDFVEALVAESNTFISENKFV